MSSKIVTYLFMLLLGTITLFQMFNVEFSSVILNWVGFFEIIAFLIFIIGTLGMFKLMSDCDTRNKMIDDAMKTQKSNVVFLMIAIANMTLSNILLSLSMFLFCVTHFIVSNADRARDRIPLDGEVDV